MADGAAAPLTPMMTAERCAAAMPAKDAAARELSVALDSIGPGVACNSCNRACVSQHADITYLKPGRLDDRLAARAHEITRSGRTGVYDVTVTAGKDLIATFRGVCREIEGRHFEEERP